MPDSATSDGWQELQTAARRQCPKLFYSFSTKEQSFTLLLTDLISIWECSLDRYDILAAAARQQTSIDPSVSADQFEVLLSKIRKSLRDGENNIIRDGRGNSQTLLLRTRIDLPRPLRPLEWTFTLDSQRSSELAERILRPSLHEVFVSQNKINSLLGIIKEKDHIISRLLDRVGNSAVDLSLVFPGIAGFASRKGGHVSAADAKKHVPGMASFDEKSWTREFANNEGYEGADRTGLSNLVRGCEKCFAHSKAEHESWVKDLPSTEESHQNDASKNITESSPSTKAAQKKPDLDRDSTDDEFERQATPPHLKSKDTKKATRGATEDEETEGDEPVSTRTESSTIGGLGRRNATKAFGASERSPDPAPAAKSQPVSRRRASTASTETATASEDDNVAGEGSESPVAPQNTSSHPAHKPKLGALRSRKVSPSPSLSPPPSHSGLSTSSARRASSEGPTSRSPPVAARVSKALEEDEEEEENDDLNGASSTASGSPSPRPAEPSTSAQQKNRLGRLGGKKQATPSSPRSTSPPPGETSTGNEITETQTPTKRKLGRLGGFRKKERETTTSPGPQDKPQRSIKEEDHDSDVTNTPSPLPSRSSSRRKTPDGEPGPRDHSPPPSTARTKPAAEPAAKSKKQETAEEAASRRRMELKRTIAAGDGGKKKRRF